MEAVFTDLLVQLYPYILCTRKESETPKGNLKDPDHEECQRAHRQDQLWTRFQNHEISSVLQLLPVIGI